MTKNELWTKVQTIGEHYDLSDEVMKELGELLKPKTRGSNRPEPKYIGDEPYFYCRYTGTYWPVDDMIYQNDEKKSKLQDKGYSKLGISLWNRGRKFVEKMKSDLTDQILSDEPNQELVKILKEGLRKADFNDKDWLYSIATDDERQLIANEAALFE